MIIKHYKVQTPAVKSPGDDWSQAWHGLYRLKGVKSKEAIERFNSAQQLAHFDNCLGEREFEVDCFLSILKDINSDSVTFMELGAGYAEWCLALAGVIRNEIEGIKFKDYRCIAVEADPQHKAWAVEHFLGNRINGTVVEAAISDKNGSCSFSIDNNPADCYGQSITVGNSLLRTIGNTLRRKKITVPCFTLKELMTREKIDKIDLIHMDVQGAESRVIRSGMDVINKGLIKYWLIGTHGKVYNKEIMNMLSPYYQNIVNLLPDAIGSVNGNRIECQDGVQVWKLK